MNTYYVPDIILWIWVLFNHLDNPKKIIFIPILLTRTQRHHEVKWIVTITDLESSGKYVRIQAVSPPAWIYI